MKRIKLIIFIVFMLGCIFIGVTNYISQPVLSQNNKIKHLVVISIDSLNENDVEKIKVLSNFKALMDKGSYSKDVIGVYPSIAYPSHTSVITGVYPDKHGILSNGKLQPEMKKPEWYWHDKDIKAPTLYELAKEKNMKVGAILWPVMAGARINYNIPEIWSTSEGQSNMRLIMSNATPWFYVNAYMRYKKILDGANQPQLDDFATEAAIYMIKSRKPNLLLLHLTDTDAQRHCYGTGSDEADASLRRQDERLGKLIQATKAVGIYEDTAFVIIGVNGQIDVHSKININSYFEKEGLIKVDSNGNITDWKAYSNSCGGSAQVYVKDDETLKRVTYILSALKLKKNTGIAAVFGREELKDMRANTEPSLMVEAKKGYYFTNAIGEELITAVSIGNIKEKQQDKAATHGYRPDAQGYHAFFLVSGKGVRQGIILSHINIVDIAPTLARLLDIKMENIDGKVLEDIIE